MSSGYRYNQTNGFIAPNTYMYPPFEGTPFFEMYFSSRNLAATQLRSAQLDKADADIQAFIGIFEQSYAVDESVLVTARQDFMRSELIDTKKFLSTAAILLVCDSSSQWTSPQSLQRAMLNNLIRKFEVTKKVYESYPTWKAKGEGSAQNTLLYAMASSVFAFAYAKTSNLKYLNATLKANDILTSVLETLDVSESFPNTAVVGLFSIASETALVRQLMARHGISNEIN